MTTKHEQEKQQQTYQPIRVNFVFKVENCKELEATKEC